MSKKFLAVFVAMFLTGAALILTIPGLFETTGATQPLVPAVLGGLFLVLAVIVLAMRSAERRSHGPRAGR
jgi:cystathionine beta-lyase family protein involved in aluminum resistance